MKFIKSVAHFFDKLEDFARAKLSKHPIPYAIVGGVFHVLFWRSIWEGADIIYRLGGIWEVIFFPGVQIFITSGVLMLTGLMVSSFIGDRIILSGLKHEKKVFETTEEEVTKEEGEIKSVLSRLSHIETSLEEILKKIK
jgi:hypothetical protein